MIKIFVTDAVISKGYNSSPALRLSENGDSVRFRIGKRVYDKREADNYRWINLNVKAFGSTCERIKKMQLKEGSFVNIVGRYDEDKWTDQTTNEPKSAPVVIVDEIEYCFSGGNGKQNRDGNNASDSSQSASVKQDTKGDHSAQSQQSQTPENFTGYETFGSANPFYPED